MDNRRAKMIYVEKFVSMIDKVLDEYDITEWMTQGEQWAHLEPVLRPKFQLVGRDLFALRDAKLNSMNGDSAVGKTWEQIGEYCKMTENF